jgi:hypothetical protein
MFLLSSAQQNKEIVACLMPDVLHFTNQTVWCVADRCGQASAYMASANVRSHSTAMVLTVLTFRNDRLYHAIRRYVRSPEADTVLIV